MRTLLSGRGDGGGFASELVTIGAEGIFHLPYHTWFIYITTNKICSSFTWASGLKCNVVITTQKEQFGGMAYGGLSRFLCFRGEHISQVGRDVAG